MDQSFVIDPQSWNTRVVIGIHFVHDYFLRYLLFVLFVS